MGTRDVLTLSALLINFRVGDTGFLVFCVPVEEEGEEDAVVILRTGGETVVFAPIVPRRLVIGRCVGINVEFDEAGDTVTDRRLERGLRRGKLCIKVTVLLCVMRCERACRVGVEDTELRTRP